MSFKSLWAFVCGRAGAEIWRKCLSSPSWFWASWVHPIHLWVARGFLCPSRYLWFRETQREKPQRARCMRYRSLSHAESWPQFLKVSLCSSVGRAELEGSVWGDGVRAQGVKASGISTHVKGWAWLPESVSPALWGLGSRGSTGDAWPPAWLQVQGQPCHKWIWREW